MSEEKLNYNRNEDNKISSEDLSALVIDALFQAGIINKENIKRGIEIGTEEINVRKALGDY